MIQRFIISETGWILKTITNFRCKLTTIVESDIEKFPLFQIILCTLTAEPTRTKNKSISYLPHTRPSKQPRPNRFIEPCKVGIRLKLFWQIQRNPGHLSFRLWFSIIFNTTIRTLITLWTLFYVRRCRKIMDKSKSKISNETFNNKIWPTTP